jgi:Fe-Mn family superoxide dismutase
MPDQTYPFQLPPLPYPPDALEPHLDARTLAIHHDVHHRTYVERLNAALRDRPEFHGMSIERLLRNLSRVPADIRTAVRNNGGGHLNHSLFWELLAAPGESLPAGPLLQALQSDFGSVDSFREYFNEVATSHFASGWAFLVADSSKGTVDVVALPDHRCVLGTHLTVLLVCDLWEHAYYLKHQSRRAEYLDCWWQVANWREAATRFGRAGRLAA